MSDQTANKEEKTNQSYPKALQDVITKSRDEEFNSILEALEKGDEWEVRRAAADWLGSEADNIAQNNRKIDDTLYRLTKSTSDENFHVRRSIWEAIRVIWDAGWATQENKIFILNRVLKVLKKDDQHHDFKKAAADWLKEKAFEIVKDHRMMDDVVEALLERAKIDERFDVRRSAVEACKDIWREGWDQIVDLVGSKQGEELSFTQRQVFRQVLGALHIEECWEVRAAAALWLREEAKSITREENIRLMTDSVNDLIKIAKKDTYPQVRLSAVEACREFWDKGWNNGDQIGSGKKIAISKEQGEMDRSRNSKSGDTNNLRTQATPLRATVLNLVLNALGIEDADEDKWEIRQSAALWLGGKAKEIGTFRDPLYMGVSDALTLIQITPSEPEELKRSAGAAQKALWASLKDTWYGPLTRMIRSQGVNDDHGQEPIEEKVQSGKKTGEEGDNEQEPTTDAIGELSTTDAIRALANHNYLGSREALSFLVNCWVHWICDDQEPQLVEYTAEAIRYNRYAVLALIEHLGKHSCKSDNSGMNGGDSNENLSKFSESSGTKTNNSVLSLTEYENRFMDDLKIRLEIWEGRKRDNVGLLDESEIAKAERLLVKIDPESTDISKDSLVEYITASKSLRVDERITKQLAEMSNPAFFEEADSEKEKIIRKHEHDHILKELKMHAVPVMLRRLAEEKDDEISEDEIRKSDHGAKEALDREKRKDDEIRKNIVRMLGYTGDREAVDALVRQVAFKERERQSRQDLLSEYYLEPARKRNEQTSMILEQSIKDSKRNLGLIQWLNIGVFIVGLVVVAVGIYLGIQGDAASSRVAGALAAVGGLAGVVIHLIRDPLDRIQNALAKLVQMETAFTTFIWELNLNSTYIQSSYIEDGELDDAEIQETVNLVEKSADLTMNMIHKYAELRTDPYIHRLKPEEGFAGSEIILIGEHLLGERTQADSSAEVYIDHGPNPGVTVFSWTDKQVLLELPSVISQGTIYISLFVDGKESNALPFRVW